jgi:hypothetical protein
LTKISYNICRRGEVSFVKSTPRRLPIHISIHTTILNITAPHISSPLLSSPLLSSPLLSSPLLSSPLLSYPLLSYPILSSPLLSYPLPLNLPSLSQTTVTTDQSYKDGLAPR